MKPGVRTNLHRVVASISHVWLIYLRPFVFICGYNRLACFSHYRLAFAALRWFN